MSDLITPPSNNAPTESTVQITHVTYALFALGLLTGGLVAIAGLIVAYIKRDDAAGSYLASHYRWLIRTFWWSFLWVSLGWLLVVVTLGIGFLVAWIPWGIAWLWGVYRIIKGWLRLSDKREVS
ncbi:MAG: hypothetical protein JNL19_03370 [Burkholderiales bacterium]|nr:hypothetical protein [Burkholderiales bacterium]